MLIIGARSKMRIGSLSHTKLIVAFLVIVIVVAVSVGYALSKFPSSNSPPKITPTQSPTASQTPPNPTPTPSATTPTQTPITATFDFDTGSPALNPYTSTPFDQTFSGVTAHFSSPTDLPSKPAFSIQSRASLASTAFIINSTLFSGNFLYPNTVNLDKLDIKFSRAITSITLEFKTAEYNDPGPGGTGSTIRLTAYLNTASNIVGSPTTKNGIETAMDIYPEGTLTFNSGSNPFNFVEIDLPNPSQGATGFIIDNIQITTTG
jgi:hypothetical protein